MDTLSRIRPDALDQYIADRELNRRRQKTSLPCEQVFRYGKFIGSAIHYYPSLNRAMDTAREHITACEREGRSVVDGTVILASSLTLPKGRFSRSWHAPPGGLWGCLLLADTLLPPFRNLLPLVPGIACCEALHQEGAGDAAVRWVNDVLVEGKKQAGFLIEGFRSPVHGENFHLMGFGLNLNNDSFPSELQETAISLAQALGRPVDLHAFTLSFLAKMRWAVGLLLYEEERWLARGGGESYEAEHPILRRWKELSDTMGRRVRFGYDVIEHPQYEALVTGIEVDGGLVLRHDDGTSSVEHSGEIRYRDKLL